MTFTDVSRADAISAEAGLVMDEDSFRAFYERNARAVWAYLARLTGDRHAADDLLQEAFYRFLRAGSAYENESHRRNALYRIATNLARDARRRVLSRPAGIIAGDDIEKVAGRDASNSNDRSADVTRALSRMKPRERAMLWLAYAEGASHNEIAATLGLKPGSMKLMLFRARRRLAGLLGKEPR
jgi:RNA polymerase sigma-70 factor (ECF subfamily)